MSSANTAATGQVGKIANVYFLGKKNCITTDVKISHGEKINSMLGREKIKMDDLIYRDKLKQTLLELGFYPAIVKSALEKAPAVDAVAIDELLELRDKLYETDKITMKGLKMLNELIEKYDERRKEDG